MIFPSINRDGEMKSQRRVKYKKPCDYNSYHWQSHLQIEHCHDLDCSKDISKQNGEINLWKKRAVMNTK